MMRDDRGEGSTVDRSAPSHLSADHEESLDRYCERLRGRPITPRQWIKENAQFASTPEFRDALWAHYSVTYPPPPVPGFVIEDVLGEGGMGRVYLGRDRSLNRQVAIKELTETLRRGGAHSERFRLEAKILAKLDHPNIVKVHQFVSHQGRNFIAMEYLGNGSLADRLDAKPSDVTTSIPRLIARLARAVDYAHREKIVHRDLKPGNILFDKYDEPKLSDFGLAKDLDDGAERSFGAALGTNHYMAPEQVEGKTPVPGTDIWALGVILIRVITGQYPFDGQTVEQLHLAIRRSLPKELPADFAPELRRICLKCLEKDPKNRYLRGNDLAADLEKVAGRDVLPWRVRVRSMGRWAAAIALGLGLVSAIGMAVPTLTRRWESSRSEPSIVMRERLKGPTQSVAFSADGRYGLVEVGGSQIVVWDLQKERVFKQFDHGMPVRNGDNCGAVAASPDGKQIAAVGLNSTCECLAIVQLYSSETFSELLPVGNSSQLGRTLAFSPDSRHIAIEAYEQGVFAALVGGPGKCRLAIYDLDKRQFTYFPAPSALSCLAFSPDGNFVATGGKEAVVAIWNRTRRSKENDIAMAASVDAVAFSENGSRIYTASIAGSSLDVATALGHRERTISTGSVTSAKMTCAAIHPSGRAVTGHRDGAVVVWNLATGSNHVLRRQGAEVSALAITRDGTQAFVAFSDRSVALFPNVSQAK